MTDIRKFFSSKQTGFTLVELLVVIVILGILAGIGVQQFTGVQERAANTVHDANIRMLKGAGQMAIFNNGGTPDEEIVWISHFDGDDYSVKGYTDFTGGAGAGDEEEIIANNVFYPDTYVDSWPQVPSGATDGWDGYKVTINDDGSIEVEDGIVDES